MLHVLAAWALNSHCDWVAKQKAVAAGQGSVCQTVRHSLMRQCFWLQVADIEKAEKEKMRHKVENIISQGLNCFVNRQLIYNFPEEIFADAGVMAIEHADFDGIERLALVTGDRL